ncbi:PD-(D/E)XK nuclease family protein [Nanoarchaeota archaeon]
MIQQVSLDHGWYYFFRVHTERLNGLPQSFSPLKDYLVDMLSNCPDTHFKNKGPRSSKLRLDLGIKPTEIEEHPIISMAQEGLDWAHYKTAHSNVQVFMLQNDPGTLAVETPIWLEKKEHKPVFNDSLSGHIDILRKEDNKIWVWDYKPNAHREKYATTQTFFYALMLSQRTGIPLNKFMCGYFDQATSFVFKPELKLKAIQ